MARFRPLVVLGARHWACYIDLGAHHIDLAAWLGLEHSAYVFANESRVTKAELPTGEVIPGTFPFLSFSPRLHVVVKSI